MSLEVRNYTETPPGLWRYRVPETGIWVKDFYAYNDLEAEVLRHYKANGKGAPSGLRQSIIDQMCQQLPEGWCHDGNRWLAIGQRFAAEFQRVLTGTTTLVDWWINAGRQRVSQEEADRRAEICSTCIFNQLPQGCTACNGKALRDLANQIVGGSATAFDSTLQACQICGCELRAKVWLPLDVLQRHIPAAQLAQFPPPNGAYKGCWLRDEVTP